jgi:uncharacterized membrane protein
MKARNEKTTFLVEMAMMIAIILIMANTPLGYIRTPGLSLTLLTVPVSVGAVILGPLGGALCGLTFGISSFVNGMSSSILFQINPFGYFITTVVTRVLVGLCTGLIFRALHKRKSTNRVSYYVTCLSCPLLNTLFFMTSLVLFFYGSDYIQNFVTALGASNPLVFVLLFVGVQGAIEAAVCFVVGSAVSRTLYGVFRKSMPGLIHSDRFLLAA